jgi:hypothetical protein
MKMTKSKPDHGIPEHVIEHLGPPAVLPRRMAQFYGLLRELASDQGPRGMSDWCLLWDMAIARIDLAQIGAAKVAGMTLLQDQAAIEIVRRDSLQYIGQNPSDSMSRDYDPTVGIFDSKAPELDMVATRSVLKRLGLQDSAVQDVAYLMAFSILTPLEILASAKQSVERMARNEIERRHSREDQLERMQARSPVLGVEFSPTTMIEEISLGSDLLGGSPRRQKSKSAAPAAKAAGVGSADSASAVAEMAEVNDNARVA